MIKHVGKHNNKRIVVLWRQVPNEDHMALVAYSDTLPRMIHDELMRVLESPVGQNSKDLNFSDIKVTDDANYYCIISITIFLSLLLFCP